ncbi:hypothetical protein J0X19_09300 [Hymenobacter sp. BT186]|uniref:Outer membrane protein beta-barrel domain-containing protein n=1 Tax=Hymenobacter telluris TaxID=2816474 RepID=A0A939JCR8_9BACT|nr:hypothetical protein [Hymenobacter telluris]MBO0358138.1 hypothetical protein [Hymenobacter telluris]MBW3374165.1 hypothetical protein [Hymenobacter norwichensis]
MLRSVRFLPSALVLLTIRLAAAQAQTVSAAATHRPALVRLGLGSSLNGSGDYGVTKLHVEYAPEFGRHLRLGSRLALLSGSELYEFGRGYTAPQSYRAVNVEQEAYWLPFGVNKAVEFSVGVGAFGGYGSQKGVTGGGLRFIDANGTPQPEPVLDYVALRERGFHIGYLASLNLDVALNQERTWRVGGRVALQHGTRAITLPGAQLVFSRAL